MDYTPIDCELHDVYEHHAVLLNSVILSLRTSGGVENLQGVITNIYQDSAAEYLSLSGHALPIRLDAITAVTLDLTSEN